MNDVTALVFGGGGARGIAYSGALFEMVRRGLDFSKLKICAGTSIGALFAAMTALNICPHAMMRKTRSRELSEMLKPDFRAMQTLFSTWGLNSAEKLRTWISDIVFDLTGRRKLTFQELFDLRDVQLVIVVTNLNYNRAEYWSHKNHPDRVIVDSICTSMALPPLFGPTVECVDTLRTYTHRNGVPTQSARVGDVDRRDGRVTTVTAVYDNGGTIETKSSERVLYVDGGLRDNFPMSISDLPSDPRCVVGLKVDWRYTGEWEIASFDKFCARIAYCTLTTADSALMARLDIGRESSVCACDVGDVSSIDFTMDDAAVEQLVEKGRLAAHRFLSRNATAADPRPRDCAEARLLATSLATGTDAVCDVPDI